uniref:Uncharacterized protein n=1 Tax=Arundo donax TaxID=35708 RepID=A0A0A9EV07_ARUDO
MLSCPCCIPRTSCSRSRRFPQQISTIRSPSAGRLLPLFWPLNSWRALLTPVSHSTWSSILDPSSMEVLLPTQQMLMHGTVPRFLHLFLEPFLLIHIGENTRQLLSL